MTIPISELDEDIKEAICTIKVTINDQKKKFNIKDDLVIDYENIETEMEEFPNKFYLWSMLYSEIKEQLAVVDKKIKKRKGIVYGDILKQGGKSLRRADIADLVEIDTMFNELEASKIILDKQSQKLWFTLEALRMKNDNLRSLSGFKKQELFQAGQSTA